MKKFSWHLIFKNGLLRLIHANFVPRVGDEVRLSAKEFYRVTRVVWCLDEPDTLGERVNIEVTRAKK